MALSEHEQRMLDAIEQALFDDDPKFASNVNPTRIRRRRPVMAGVVFLIGVATLIGGAMTATLALPAAGIPLAVLGFVLMVAGVGLLVYGIPGAAGLAAPRTPKGPVSSPLSARMEERFRRRFDDQ